MYNTEKKKEEKMITIKLFLFISIYILVQEIIIQILSIKLLKNKVQTILK